MSDEPDWEARERDAIESLAVVGFLVGEWAGEGTSHGEAVRGKMSVSAVMGGTFVEAREWLIAPDGTIDHEDRAIYRYNFDEKQLRVIHLMRPSWVVERRVMPLDPSLGVGVRWYAGPFSPEVRFISVEGGLRSEVWLPMVGEPDVVMHYRRV